MLAFDPRARYLTGPPVGSPSYALRKRRLLAFDARRRYLTGLGVAIPANLPVTGFDTSVLTALNPPPSSFLAPALTAAQQAFMNMQNWAAQPAVAVTPGRALPVAVTPSTVAAIANAAPGMSTTPPSWLSRTNSVFGIPNGWLLGGAGALAALVLLSGGRRRR